MSVEKSSFSMQKSNTVKPVYNDHPWNPKFVVVVRRSLYIMKKLGL